MCSSDLNSVPDSAVFTVDFRTLPDDDHAALISMLGRLFGPDARIEVVTEFKGFATAPHDAGIAPLLRILAERLGRPPVLLGAPYFTDASALVPGFSNVPTVVIGPGASAQCHKTDEHCPITDIEEATVIYEELIRRVCM